MNAVRFNQLYLLVTGIILIICGVLIINESILIFSIFNLILPIILTINGISHFFQFSKHKKNWLLKSLVEFLLALICFFSNVSFIFLMFFFGVYILVKSVALLEKYWDLRSNHVSGRISILLNGTWQSIIGISLLFSVFLSQRQILLLLSTYMILAGLANIFSGIRFFTANDTFSNIKRRIRLTPPVLVEALVPRFVLKKTNEYLSSNDNVAKGLTSKIEKRIEETKDIEIPDLEILIHVTEKSFGSIGHMDLSFEGKVVSYGNYDADSSRLFELFGDGVLTTGAKRDQYIPFCIEHDKKTLFCFGIKLTDEQRQGIREKIANLCNTSFVWKSHGQRNPDEKYSDYASCLTGKTDCQLHKFHHGMFKTYFVLTTNCVLLADTILGPSGINLLTINGILTPGTYLDFLLNEFQKASSNVKTLHIYNKS